MFKINLLKLIVIVLLVLLLVPGLLMAQDSNAFFSLGVGLGEPSYIAGRYYLNPNNLIEVNLGLTLVRPFFNNISEVYDSNMIKLNLGIGYVINLFLTRTWDLPLYLGAGINLRFDSYNVTRFGIKFPYIGIEKMFQSGALKWGLYLDLAVITNLTPEGQGFVDWVIVVFDEDPLTNSMSYFLDVFDLQFTFGLRFYIRT